MNNSKHPKGLYLIFATSTAERFSYYGMRAIFILFLTQALLFDTEKAASIYGSYTGLVYLTPLIGGYVADKYWGIRRSVFWGAMLMAIGQFLMFFSASMLDAQELSHGLMYGGLTFLILGNGFFKPTVSSLVGQLYEPGDRRLDSAYTIFYMGVNVGSFLAPLVCGYFGETGNPQDFKWGFLIAAIVTVFTVVLFETQKNRYLIGPDGQQLGVVPDARKATEGTSAKTQTPEDARRKRRKRTGKGERKTKYRNSSEFHIVPLLYLPRMRISEIPAMLCPSGFSTVMLTLVMFSSSANSAKANAPTFT